jgi:GntR family transcriptional repressor for pyruvate dehydrogenase complex
MAGTSLNRPRTRGRDGLRPQKTAALLAQRIVGEITDGGLQQGSPLPPEKTMLEEYGVARGTLREALRFLEIQGVITIKTGPGGGPIVNRPGSRHLASIIAMMLQLEQASFRTVLEARVVLEPELARRAAARATDEQAEELHQSVVRMRETLADEHAFVEENALFHELIAEIAGNPVFTMVLASLTWICDGTPLGVQYPPASREAVVAEHARIHRAIAARDADRAGAAMSVHMGDFAAYLEAKYPQVLDAPLRWDQVDA